MASIEPDFARTRTHRPYRSGRRSRLPVLLENRGGGPYAPQTAGVSFNGVTLADSGYLPPDSTGDVGLTDIFVAANGRFRSFNKAGVMGAINTTPENFFNSVRNGSGISDPRVRYDRLSNRWIVAAINVAGSNNRILLAVSNSGTLAGATWTFFFFQCNTGGTADDNNAFADYPTMGVDNNAIYIGANMFKGNFWGATAWVIRKSSVLGAGPIVFTPFRQICNSTGAGIYTPLGVDNWNASATEGYLIGVSGNAWSTLVMRRIGTPGGTPTISGNINLTVPTTTSPSTVPALGSTGALSAVDDRLFDAQICHNKITGTRTLWTGHHFRVNNAGVANTSGGRHGSRWYEITNLSGTPSLVQSGTVYDSAASNIKNYWFPGVTMTGQGHMAMGISYAGTANRAGVAAVGRLRTAALGTTQTPDLVQVSSSAYNAQSGNGQRWGDYSRTAVDPADDMTCWTFQEWCNANNSWAVRVVQLRAPLPATPSSVSSTVIQGQSNVNVTVTGTSTAGTEFFDPGAGYPNRIAASVSGTGVTVNSITFSSPTSITLNLTVAADATTGLRSVTVTNPDGQQDPGIVGVSSGAVMGAAAQIVLGWSFAGTWSVTFAAFIGGLITVAAVYFTSRSNGRTEVVTLILTGIAVNGLVGALIGLLTYFSDDAELRSITFWTLGSVAQATWTKVGAVAPVALGGIFIAMLYARRLDLLALGERPARHLGVDVERLRVMMLVVVAMLTAAAVAVSGIVLFIGLVVPHLIRMVAGPGHRLLLPASALGGATLLVAADLAARTLASPAEIPLGVLTSLVGSPFFFWQLRRTRSRQGGWA